MHLLKTGIGRFQPCCERLAPSPGAARGDCLQGLGSVARGSS